MSNQSGSAKNAKSGPTSIVYTVVNECQAGVTAEKNTVTQAVNRQLTGNVTRRDVTLASTKRNSGRNVTLKACKHCGGDYETKRPSQSKYCGPQCRRNAWLLRNPDKAAALAESDRQRLRNHLESRGVIWQERYTNER